MARLRPVEALARRKSLEPEHSAGKNPGRKIQSEYDLMVGIMWQVGGL